MSLLWIKVASYADVSPEIRERRKDRVKNWVDRQRSMQSDDARVMEIPSKFGPHAVPDKVHDLVWNHTTWNNQGHLLGNVHSHHLPWREVPLDGNFHHTQPHVLPEILHHKIDGEDDDGMPTVGMFDEHDPSPDPIVLKHQGQHYLLDGHHRFVEHRLMGKPTMMARVYDADDPKAGPEHCYECGEHKEYCADCGGTPDWERDR